MLEVMDAIGIGCWNESSSMTFGGGIEDVDEDDSSDGGSGSEGKFIFVSCGRRGVLVYYHPNVFLQTRLPHQNKIASNVADYTDTENDRQTGLLFGTNTLTDRLTPSAIQPNIRTGQAATRCSST